MKVNPEEEKLPGQLEVKLDAFRTAFPERDPQASLQNRDRFLALADAARGEFAASQAASKGAEVLPRRWLPTFVSSLTRWNKRSLMTAFGTLLAVIALLFGGAGGTYAAAQDSLPGGPLYAVKIWSEDTRLDLAEDQQERIDLSLEFADRRLAESAAMISVGDEPPETVLLRYQEQIEQAIAIASGMEAEDSGAALLRVQERLQEHEREMLRIELRDGSPAQAVLDRVRERIHEHQQSLDERLSDKQTPNGDHVPANGLQNKPENPPEPPGQGVPGGGHGPDGSGPPGQNHKPEDDSQPGNSPSDPPGKEHAPGQQKQEKTPQGNGHRKHNDDHPGNGYGPGGRYKATPHPGGEKP